MRQIDNGGVAKAKQGSKNKFTWTEEDMMVQYLDECWALSIPKSKDVFVMDLVNYMQCYSITNTFPNTVPGHVTIILGNLYVSHNTPVFHGKLS